ncbi:MAG: hypothetical protein IKE91_08765 [Clostridia bacterium]|nr:hypothetical protein [Clostridia bacterium]
MSLQTYNKPVFFDDRVVTYDASSGTTGTLDSLNTKLGLAMEFQANIKILSGRDRYRVRSTTFTIVGKNETATGGRAEIGNGMYGLIEAGSRMASLIAKMSKGVIVGFFAKLGKYRQDEMPINVPTGDNSYGTLIYNNSVDSEYSSDECGRNAELPATPASTAIRIPWLRDDISRQDIKNNLDDWRYDDTGTGGSGFVFQVGQVKFKDDNKVDLVAIPTTGLHSIKVAERSYNLGQLLVNNDSQRGIIDDKVLSEKQSGWDSESGQDDGEIQPDDGTNP